MSHPNPNQPRVSREVPQQWDWFIRLAETIHYGTIDKIEFREKKPKFVRLNYDLDLEDIDKLKKVLDEFRTISLIE